MNITELPKDVYLEINSGVSEDITDEGVTQSPIFIAKIRTLAGRCNLNHSHWHHHIIKHTDLVVLGQLIETYLKEKQHNG